MDCDACRINRLFAQEILSLVAIKPLYIHAASPEKSGVLILRRVQLARLLALSVGLTGANPGAADTFAPSPYFVNSWGAKEGLPQSSVISLVKSQDGYLWLGTLRGLVRFDGEVGKVE